MDEQEIKQSFLREEILQQNFDPQAFIDFLIEKKGEGADDINNWTLEDLEIVVKDFKNKWYNRTNKSSEEIKASINSLLEDVPSQVSANNTNKHITPFPLSGKDEIESKDNLNFKNEKDNLKTYYNEETNNEWELLRKSINSISSGNNSNDYPIGIGETNISLEIECLEPDHSPLSKYENLEVKISSPEKNIESTGIKGFFTKKYYYSFQIEINNPAIKSRRRYTDFEWLRKTFLKLYPGNYIPPLPQKSLPSNSSDKKVQKYEKILERFMNEIMEDILLKNSSILYLFLSTEKDTDFNSLMQKYEKVQKTGNLHYFYSKSGKLYLDESVLNTSKNLFEIKTEITKYNNVFTNLNKSLKLLEKEMNQVSERLMEISKQFKEIYELSITNSEKESLCKCYSNLELIFKEYAGFELQQIKDFCKETKVYFNYVNLKYVSSLREMFDNFEYQNHLFLKVSEKLKQRKEQLYNARNPEQWELRESDMKIDFNNKNECISKMLPKETAMVREIKKHLIYYATQLKEEREKLKDTLGDKHWSMIRLLREGYFKGNKNLNNLWELIMKIKNN